VLISSTINGNGGTYNYQAKIQKTSVYIGATYIYTWNVTTDPTITYSVTNDSTISITKTNNAKPMVVSVIVTATANPYAGCNTFVSLNPCQNFTTNNISEIIPFSFAGTPQARYSVAPVANTINPSGSYSYQWWMGAPIPPNAVLATPTTATVSVSQVLNTPSNANGNELNLQMRVDVKEASNNSNGCVATASADFEPCVSFQPAILVTSNTSGSATCQAVVSGAFSDYTYTWTVFIPASGVSIYVPQNAPHTCTYSFTPGITVYAKLTITQKNGTKCQKEVIKQIAGGGDHKIILD